MQNAFGCAHVLVRQGGTEMPVEAYKTFQSFTLEAFDPDLAEGANTSGLGARAYIYIYIYIVWGQTPNDGRNQTPNSIFQTLDYGQAENKQCKEPNSKQRAEPNSKLQTPLLDLQPHVHARQ